MDSSSRWKLKEIDILAAVAMAAIVTLGFFVKRTLNPDGVSYLDLASALQRSDWIHFVQGYWSPLYPALLAAVGTVTGGSVTSLVSYSHMVNVIAVIATIGVIWHWARQLATPWFGRAAIAALFLCSAEPPRVEALTPDLILLAITTCIAYELVMRGGRRTIRIGVLLGLAYLTKTSTWPWILVAGVVRIAAAEERAARIAAVRSFAIATGIALLWIAPLSVLSLRPTLGATARLNYRWYLESSDARTPDTHLGDHAQYQLVPASDSVKIRTASFDTTAHLTYQPWSDPEVWSFGIKTHQAVPPRFGMLLSYWLDTTWQAAWVWLRMLLLVVLVPAVWLGWRRGKGSELLARRNTLIAIVLGLIGIAQYIAVHAEPRLIAPFVLLSTLALLYWLVGDGVVESRAHRAGAALSLVGLVVAAYITGRRIQRARVDDTRIAFGVEQLERVNAAAFGTDRSSSVFGGGGGAVPAHPRVAVIGPVLPVLANIFWTGGRVVAQVPPMSVNALRTLPVDQRTALLHGMFSDHADVIWITASDGSYNIVRVP